jgi:hypothetical protein
MRRKEEEGRATVLARRGTSEDSLVELKRKRLVMCSKASAVFAGVGVPFCRPLTCEFAREVKKHCIVVHPKFLLPLYTTKSFVPDFASCCIFSNLAVMRCARPSSFSPSCNSTLCQTVSSQLLLLSLSLHCLPFHGLAVRKSTAVLSMFSGFYLYDKFMYTPRSVFSDRTSIVLAGK